MHNDEWNNEKMRSWFYLVSLPLICIVIYSLLLLSSTSWSIFDNFLDFKANTVLAIPNVPANNNETSAATSTTTNYPPESTVGPDQTVNENTTVMLVGGAFDRNTNDKLNYSWIQTAGPPIILNRSNTTSTTFIAPDVLSDTTLKFSLTAKDDKGAVSNKPAIATVIVKPVNHSPIANVGPDQIVDAGNIISLDGSNTTDPDGDTLSYSWVQIDGPEVELSGADTFMATLTAPSNNITSDTDLSFKLAVTDSKNASSTDDVKVTVKYIPPPNKPPIANAGQDQLVDAGDTVTLDGNASSDLDSNITSYSWIQNTGPAVVLSNANTMKSSFIAPTVSNDTNLQFSLTAKDDKGTTSTPATVSITTKAAMPTAITPAPTAGITNESSQPTGKEYAFVRKWGTSGTGDGQFDNPNGIAVDSSGNVYVVDTGNYRIQKFDNDGTFITKWGTSGTGDGQFDNPNGIAVDSSGNVYVSEFVNDRIQKFDNDGTFITKWGSYGTEDGQFDNPNGIAVDSSGNVYVVDNNDRVQKFDSNGNFITKWGSYGEEEDGQFYYPEGVAVDASGNVCVADSGNDRIQKFDSDGNFITKWGSNGTGDGQFSLPRFVAVDSSGNVYVADYNNDRIQKFDRDGNFITKWGSYGTEDGQFNNPEGVAVDSSDNVYVADAKSSDSGNDRIQVFAPSSSK